MSNQPTYLPCSIYRSDYDASCNKCYGFKSVYLPIKNGFMTLEKISINNQRAEMFDTYPIPLVIKSRGNYIYAEPDLPVPIGHVGYMFGGTYACTSDSRFNETFGHSYPIPIHDRTETQAGYDSMSI